MDDVNLDSPGGRLKWARQQAGFATAAEFAKRYGYNPTSYRAYENDQNGYAKIAPPEACQLRGGIFM